MEATPRAESAAGRIAVLVRVRPPSDREQAHVRAPRSCLLGVLQRGACSALAPCCLPARPDAILRRLHRATPSASRAPAPARSTAPARASPSTPSATKSAARRAAALPLNQSLLTCRLPASPGERLLPRRQRHRGRAAGGDIRLHHRVWAGATPTLLCLPPYSLVSSDGRWQDVHHARPLPRGD